MLFSIRLGLLVWERTVNLCKNWLPESINTKTGNPVPGGDWALYGYK